MGIAWTIQNSHGVQRRKRYSLRSIVIGSIVGFLIYFEINEFFFLINEAKSVKSAELLDIMFGELSNFTFPSVEERIQIYMGKWYDRPSILVTSEDESIADDVCKKIDGFNVRADKFSSDHDLLYSGAGLISEVSAKKKYWTVDAYLAQALSIIKSSVISDIDSQASRRNLRVTSLGPIGGMKVKDLSTQNIESRNGDNDKVNDAIVTRSLTQDGSMPIGNAMTQTGNGFSMKEVFIILHVGDSSSISDLPIVAKTRVIPSSSNIIWPLHTQRHFGPVDKYRKSIKWWMETYWENKKPTLIFRGAISGLNVRHFENGPRVQAVTANFHYDIKDIDVGFVGKHKSRKEYNGYVKMWKSSMRDQLRYKYILSVPGNDVASGLKWQLASDSVVFMAKPTVISYAMEHLLVPFVHYVPVNDDYTNLMEMVEWARANDDKCKWIAQQATEYMNRLYGTAEADRENKLIARGLASRYIKQFSPTLKTCASS